MGTRESFFIGELAERSGTTRDAIRYYESVGVLPEPRRSEAGYRVYGVEAVDRLRFVDQAKALGLTLGQIAEVLAIVAEEREPCPHVRRALQERLVETRSRIRELRELEARLADALTRARDGGPTSGPGCRCPIIEEAARPAVTREAPSARA